MARPLRIDYVGAYYHVNERREIFRGDQKIRKRMLRESAEVVAAFKVDGIDFQQGDKFL